MKHIVNQLFVTAAFLGGWVFVLMILFMCGLPLPHTHAFTRLGRLVGYDPWPKANHVPQPAEAGSDHHPAVSNLKLPQRRSLEEARG